MDIFYERLLLLYEEQKDKNPRCGRRMFAKICNISFYKMDNYLSRKGLPTIDTFCIIAKSLGINPSWLLGLSEDRFERFEKIHRLTVNLNDRQMELVEEFINYLNTSERIIRK